MSEQDNGGPAFPVSTGDPTKEYQDGPYTAQFPGMTLRDYFAAKAMLMAYYCESGSPTCGGTHGNPTYEGIAKRAYLMADAMLKARSAK